MRPQRLAWGLALGAGALFLLGTNVQSGWLIVLASLLAGALGAGALLPVFAQRGIEVERRAPPEAEAGSAVPVTLVVRNNSRSRRGLVAVHDRFLGDGTAVVSSLGPAQEAEYAGRRRDARRGVHTSGTCELVTGAPFGVVLVRREIEIRTRTIVHPKIFDVDIDELMRGGDSYAAARARRAPSGDTATVREYRPGDPLRGVHWRSTARIGRLVVREYEDVTGSDLTVAAGTSADGDVLDCMASAACSLAVAAINRGMDVGIAGYTPVATRREVLEWGASLGRESPPLAASLRGAGARTIACALDAADHDGAAALVRIAAAGAAAIAVVVERPDRAAREMAERLRSAGVHAVAARPGEDPGRWFASRG